MQKKEKGKGKMKNTKIKLLTATACLALVGTASAAWVYSGTATESANIGVKVASYADAGEIIVSGADNVYVYLDKGSVAFKKEDTTKSFNAKYVKPTQFTDSTKTVTLYYQVVINVNLANIYIDFANDSDVYDNTENGKYSNWYEFTSEEEILDNVSFPELTWEGTYSDLLANEATYINLVSDLTGNSAAESSSWYDQNTEWTAKSEFDCLINFKAVVSD